MLHLNWCLSNNFSWGVLEAVFIMYFGLTVPVLSPLCFTCLVLQWIFPRSFQLLPLCQPRVEVQVVFLSPILFFCTCTDDGQISGPEKLQSSPNFRIFGPSMLQGLEFNFGKLCCFLAALLGDFLSSMKRVNSNPAGRVSRLVLGELTCPGCNSRELIELFCSIQSRVVKQLNFPPNSVFYCTFDGWFL